MAPPPDLWSRIASKRKSATLKNYALLILLLLLLLGGLAYMIYSNFQGSIFQAKVESPESPMGNQTGLVASTSEELLSFNEKTFFEEGDGNIDEDFDLVADNSSHSEKSEKSRTTTRDFSETDGRLLQNFMPGGKAAPNADQTFWTDRNRLEEKRISGGLTDYSRTTAIDGFEPGSKDPFSLENLDGRRIGERAGVVSPLFSGSTNSIERKFTSLGLEGKSNRSLFCLLSRGPECFEPRIPLRYFAIDFMAGPDFFSKSLKPSSSEGEDLAELRRETESYAFSYGATIRLSAVLQNGLALRAGLSANQINEKFTYVDPDHERRRVVNVLVDTIINAPNDTTFIFDTLSIIESGERIRTVFNRYQMLDVPLMIGYEHRHGNWTFTASGGVMFNVAFKTRGEIMSASGDPVGFPDPETNGSFFRARLGMSLTGSFGAAYRINSRYSAIVEPRFVYRLKPLTLDNYPVEQNYFVFGIQAGLRYRFR